MVWHLKTTQDLVSCLKVCVNVYRSVLNYYDMDTVGHLIIDGRIAYFYQLGADPRVSIVIICAILSCSQSLKYIPFEL